MTIKQSKEEIIAQMNEAGETAAEFIQAWAEKYPEAAKELGTLMRTFVPTAGYKRLGHNLAAY